MKKQIKIFMILLLLIFSTLAEQVIIATSLPSTEETERTSESSTIGVGKLDQLLDNDESTEASPLEVSPEELRSPDTKIDDETQEITAYAGTCTEQDPFTAGTAAELQTVTQTIQTAPGAGPFHIQLTADIVLRNNVPSGSSTTVDRFNLYKDTVIDGQGFHLLMPNDSLTYVSFFAAQNNGINITFQNINFGSNQLVDQNGITYGRSGIYGIIGYPNTSLVEYNMTLENITFYTDDIENLFVWQSQSKISVFRMKGNNQIIISNTHERTGIFESPNMIFEEDSYTYIESGIGKYVFYIHPTQIPNDYGNLFFQSQKNSKLEIVTGKQTIAFGAGAAWWSIDEEAELFIRGSSSNDMAILFTHSMLSSVAFLIVGKNAKVDIVSESNFELNMLEIQFDQPEYFRLEALGEQLGSDMNLFFKRIDGIYREAGEYQITFMDILNQPVTKEINGGGGFFFSLNEPGSNGKVFIYHRKFSIESADSVPEVGVGISRITTSINTIEPAERPLTKYQLKLSTRQLWYYYSWNEHVNTATSQTHISNATLDTDGVLAIESSASESLFQKDNLPAGTYYVYVRVTGVMHENPELQKYLSESLWHEFVVEVPRSPISVEVPLEKFFNVRESGEFDESAKALPIINHSNFSIDFKVTDVVEESTDSPVTLVNSHVPGAEKHLQLYLAATNGQHTGPLVVGSNDGNAIEVLPFLEDPLKLYLRGHYSGPIDGRHDVRYRFTYQLTPR